MDMVCTQAFMNAHMLLINKKTKVLYTPLLPNLLLLVDGNC